MRTKAKAPSAGSSRSQRRAINIGFGALALGALVWAAMYSGDTSVDQPANAAAVTGGGELPESTDSAAAGAAVESFLPRSGQGSTCTEPIGVDLIPGYGATLRINGRNISDSELNRYVDDPENPGGTALQAGASLNQYTWGPEPGCPNGELIRPKDNLVEACVYRLTDGPSDCRMMTFRFDAL